MELREGYKQTEVGVIPEDWECFPFNQVSDIVDGDRGVNYPNGDDFSGDGYCLFLNAKNVTRAGFRFDEYQFITRGKDESLSKGKLSRGDIVLTTRGTVGNIAFFGKDISYENIRINSGMVILRVCESKGSTREYFYKFCQSYLLEKQIDKMSFGSAQPQLTVKGISTFQIPLPPTKTEQTAIATALSDTDSLIEGLGKLIAKKRNIKKGAMQRLLTPKEGWEVKKLGEIAEIIGGGTPSTSNLDYWNGEINWFTPTEIGSSKYSYRSTRRITKDGLNSSSAKLLPINTILLTSRASIGEVSILKKEGCTNQGFQSLIARNEHSNEFLYYLLVILKPLLIQNASGSTFLEISPGKLAKIEIEVPKLKIQINIATILSDMDNEIATLETKLKKYKMIKQGMMQNLLTGKIRLV